MACVLNVACYSGSDAGKTLCKIRDDVGTVVAPNPSADHRPSLTRAPIPSDVMGIITSLEELETAERGSEIDYHRGNWRHWIDSDKDCQDTRAEALIQESLDPVYFATDDRCRVAGGEWLGPWSAEVFRDASDVDVDHHVPLGHAHAAGGWQWDPDRKRDYANDLSNPASLQVISALVNRAKGKKAPDEWRPENPASWCRYAADWISVKQQWELTVNDAEVHVLADMLNTCEDAGSWGTHGARTE